MLDNCVQCFVSACANCPHWLARRSRARSSATMQSFKALLFSVAARHVCAISSFGMPSATTCELTAGVGATNADTEALLTQAAISGLLAGSCR